MIDNEFEGQARACNSSDASSSCTAGFSVALRDDGVGNHITITKFPAGMAVVQPACEDLLRPILSYQEVTFRRNSRGQVSRGDTTKYVCELQDCGLIIPSGCVRRVEEHLKQCGHIVNVVDRRVPDAHFSLDNVSGVEHSVERFPGLAAKLRTNREGIIEVGTGNRQAEIIAAMCQLSPQAKFLIASRTIKAAQELAENLRPFLGRQVEAVHGHNWRYSCRVVCCTFGSLDRSDPQDWDVLIFADAFDGIQETNNDSRTEYLRRRVYALVDPRRPRSQADELLFETLAGEVIYRDSKDPRAARDILSVAFTSHSSPDFPGQKDPRERHISLRSDESRNRALADMASALASGEASSDANLELNLPGMIGLPSLGSKPGVIIVVDSDEHGEQLQRLLPSWRLYDGRPNACTTSTERRSTEAWGVPRNSIVTAVAAQKLVAYDSRIIIWASGGARPFIPRYFDRLPVPCLLIDFWDDGNVHQAKDTQDRLQFYRSINCRILGNDLIHQECQLAQRVASRHSGSPRNTSRRPHRSNRSQFSPRKKGG